MTGYYGILEVNLVLGHNQSKVATHISIKFIKVPFAYVYTVEGEPLHLVEYMRFTVSSQY